MKNAIFFNTDIAALSYNSPHSLTDSISDRVETFTFS